MKKYLIYLLLLVSTFGLTGCTQQPDRIVQAKNPQVVINSVDTGLIKSKIIQKMIDEVPTTYMLQADTEYSLVFTRTLDGMEAVGVLMMIGNSYSSQPVQTVRFNIIKNQHDTRVLEYASASTQMPMGQVNTIEINNNAHFNFYYNFLQGLKNDIEKKQ